MGWVSVQGEERKCTGRKGFIVNGLLRGCSNCDFMCLIGFSESWRLLQGNIELKLGMCGYCERLKRKLEVIGSGSETGFQQLPHRLSLWFV